jgi:hypothetical protein
MKRNDGQYRLSARMWIWQLVVRDLRLECPHFLGGVDELEPRFIWLPDRTAGVRLARDSRLGRTSGALDYFFTEEI